MCESLVSGSDSLDGESPPTALAMSNVSIDLARAMEDRGDMETASTLCQQVVEERRAALGSGHRRTQAAVRMLHHEGMGAALTLGLLNAAGGAMPSYLAEFAFAFASRSSRAHSRWPNRQA